jgi:hypothetical protein
MSVKPDLGPEPIDAFERELQQALQRRPAPPGLKRKIMARRSPKAPRTQAPLWMRLAASIAIVALIGVGVVERNREEERKGEAARQQVFTALRLTNRALTHVNRQLASHNRAQDTQN